MAYQAEVRRIYGLCAEQHPTQRWTKFDGGLPKSCTRKLGHKGKHKCGGHHTKPHERVTWPREPVGYVVRSSNGPHARGSANHYDGFSSAKRNEIYVWATRELAYSWIQARRVTTWGVNSPHGFYQIRPIVRRD